VVFIKQVAELLETGIYETFQPARTMTVKDLLSELNLEGKYFGILVNGKKADEGTKISPEDSIVILPHIAGGR
jgi:sulfur carrier protein ThiS